MWRRFTGWLQPAWWSYFHGSKCRMFCIRYFDPWRWEHHAGSKRRSPITHWCGEISEKNGNLNSTAAKTKDSFLLCLPWYCSVSSVLWTPCCDLLLQTEEDETCVELETPERQVRMVDHFMTAPPLLLASTLLRYTCRNNKCPTVRCNTYSVHIPLFIGAMQVIRPLSHGRFSRRRFVA